MGTWAKKNNHWHCASCVYAYIHIDKQTYKIQEVELNLDMSTTSVITQPYRAWQLRLMEKWDTGIKKRGEENHPSQTVLCLTGVIHQSDSRRLFEIYVTQKIRVRGWEWKKETSCRISKRKYNKRRYLRMLWQLKGRWAINPIQVCARERHARAPHLFCIAVSHVHADDRRVSMTQQVAGTAPSQSRGVEERRGFERLWIVYLLGSSGSQSLGLTKMRKYPVGGSWQEKSCLLMLMGRLAGHQRKATGALITTKEHTTKPAVWFN